MTVRRIHWYCNWLYVPCTREQVRRALDAGVKDEQFVKVKDRGTVYYKNRPKQR